MIEGHEAERRRSSRLDDVSGPADAVSGEPEGAEPLTRTGGPHPRMQLRKTCRTFIRSARDAHDPGWIGGVLMATAIRLALELILSGVLGYEAHKRCPGSFRMVRTTFPAFPSGTHERTGQPSHPRTFDDPEATRLTGPDQFVAR
jgi:hypothetical protein